MRLHEILRPLSADEQAEIDRICSARTPPDVRAAIENSWRRDPPVQLDSELLSAMYGETQEETLKLRKLRAETTKIEAEAAKIAAEADDHRCCQCRRG